MSSLAAQAEVVYRNRDSIVAELTGALQARFPDANLTPDTVWYAWVATMATSVEGLYLANQLLHNDMFIQTASGVALIRQGEMFGRPIKGGTPSTGTVLIAGQGGTTIPVNTQLAAPQASDEAVTFSVTVGGTIPSPGIPTAPTLADAGAGSLPAGTYEYAATFQTIEGETILGAVSAPLVIAANRNISVTNVPLGGPGTVARNIYRRVDGGPWTKNTHGGVVSLLNNNSTTSFTDGSTTLGGPPPDESTAERLTVTAESDETGNDQNVGPGTITEFVSTLPGLTSVTNLAAFTYGSDDEDIEEYRSKLAEWVRAPKSGSPLDLKVWAEAVAGVETAAVIENDNLGTPTTGHVTVRISGPNGAIPTSDVIADVQAELVSKDIANVIIHVGTFTADAVAVTVTLALNPGYSLADVSASVTKAIQDYINDQPVGGTIYREGIAHAVFGLSGIATLVVDVPAADVTVAANHKAVPGAITVN